MDETIRDILISGARALRESDVESPRLEARLLLQHLLRRTDVELFSDMDRIVSSPLQRKYRRILLRRSGGEPLQYLTGRVEFYGLDLHVARGVLIPRPETEMLVEKAVDLCRGRPVVIADIGTGSGCIAVALAVNLPRARIVAIDKSPIALRIARRNARRYGVARRISFRRGNLLRPLEMGMLHATIDLLIANPPYVPKGDIAKLQREVRREPRMALDGGRDGLTFVRKIIHDAPSCIVKGGAIILEIGAGQADAVHRIVRDCGQYESMEISKDFAGIERRVTAVCRRS